MKRKVDELGRVVLPIEIRNDLNITNGDILSLCVEADKIIMNKVNSSCVFCLSEERLISIKKRYICLDCVDLLRNADENTLIY